MRSAPVEIGRSLAETKKHLAAHALIDDAEPAKADLFEIMYQFGDELTDYSTFYFGHAAVNFASGKMKAAEGSYAKKIIPSPDFQQTALNGFVLLIDGTTFGKGDEGLYITEKAIFWRRKEVFSDEVTFEYELREIEDISVDDKNLHINGNSYEHGGLSEERMQIIVKCIKTYISQFK